jgi:hypothetical protein
VGLWLELVGEQTNTHTQKKEVAVEYIYFFSKKVEYILISFEISARKMDHLRKLQQTNRRKEQRERR